MGTLLLKKDFKKLLEMRENDMARPGRTPEEIKKLRDRALKDIKKDFTAESKDEKRSSDNTSFGKNTYGKSTFGKS